MAFKQNNPLSRKTSPINKNWIKGAIKRPGAFKKKAEEAGMSTKAFAEKVTSNKDNYDSRTGKQAELAETLMGMSRDSFTMDELNETSKKQKIESKKQADKLPQIEFPGSDYEMDQDMSYPGGERGRDYNEEGTKDGMSRHTSEHSTEEYMERKDAAIKKSKGVSRVASPLNAGMDDMEDMDSGKEDKSEDKSEEKKPGNSRAEIKARKSKQKSEGVSGSKRRANKAKSKSEAAAEKAKTAKNPDYKKQLEAKSERLAKRSIRKEKRSERKARNKENRNKNKESRESQRS